MCPNIDRKGRIARAVTGSMCIAFGVVCWLIDWPGGVGMRWVVILGALSAGAFQLYEAKKSWCVMRACGVKTPM